MKYVIRLSSIEKKAPDRFTLPATFHAFVERCRQFQRGDLGWFAVAYTDPSELLGFDARKDLLPVLQLPDGGYVGFWFGDSGAPAIVHCSSEGEARLVAASWADFLTRLARRKTSVPDLDDRESDEFPRFRGIRQTVAALTGPRRKFRAYLNRNQSEPAADGSTEGEEIRRELVRLMQDDFDDARRRMEKLLGHAVEDDYEEHVAIIAHLTSRSYSVSEPSGRPYPNADRLRPILDRLVAHLGRPLKKSDITLWSNGSVFIEGNYTLGDPGRA